MVSKSFGGRWPAKAIALGMGVVVAAVGISLVTEVSPARSETVPPTQLGINPGGIFVGSTERSLANLAQYGDWTGSTPTGGWTAADPAIFDQAGNVKQQPGPVPHLHLTMQKIFPSPKEDIVCTWQGSVAITVNGAVQNARGSRGKLRYRETVKSMGDPIWLEIEQRDGNDPLRELDCREESLFRDALFGPAFLSEVKPFKVARFMDWQWINGNDRRTPANWRTAKSAVQSNAPGVSFDYIVQLSVQAGVNPWVVIPFNADDDYVRKMAAYLRDNLPADRTIYVELGNEIWNYNFPATIQSSAEGLAGQMGADGFQALLVNYARRSAHAFTIFSQALAPWHGKLVRVVSTQNYNPWTATLVLAEPSLRGKVDALATAPYFFLTEADIVAANNAGGLDAVFKRLEGAVDETLGHALENKRVAAKYGLRYIAYEGGQHLVIPSDLQLLDRIEHDPRMGMLYTRYLQGWNRDIGDLLTLFSLTGPPSPPGAWGLRDYTGQPLSEAPKAAAVDAFLRQNR